ncbi:hypothetical protein [Herbaspirillum huttiense]|uniref:hypothetical protein n=1 Tax=Herbaspirillum huttiense TaxID=863372 RepID=UPI0039B11634
MDQEIQFVNIVPRQRTHESHRKTESAYGARLKVKVRNLNGGGAEQGLAVPIRGTDLGGADFKVNIRECNSDWW